MNTVLLSPFVASALDFAFKKATDEGKLCICVLLVVSVFSWTVIISKGRQLLIARKMGRRFFSAYRQTKDPLDISRRGDTFTGAPAYELYTTGADELNYHLKHNPLDMRGQTRISVGSFDTVRVVIERAASAQAISLEQGMIILSTAVAGGPFIGLLGTVWGVMETFSGIARAQAATLQAMAPGVAGALIATVVGLFVAIPAMFAYNYMVTTIRAITQELDAFASEFATQMEHRYVDNRSLADELRDALQGRLPPAGREPHRQGPAVAGLPRLNPAAMPARVTATAPA